MTRLGTAIFGFLFTSISYGSIYEEIANQIFPNLDGKNFQGQQETDGKDCGIEFLSQGPERPDIQFYYSPSERYAKKFGNEKISGNKFSGTLGFSLIYNSGFLWTTKHHIVLDKSVENVRIYYVEAGLGEVVACKIDKP